MTRHFPSGYGITVVISGLSSRHLRHKAPPSVDDVALEAATGWIRIRDGSVQQLLSTTVGQWGTPRAEAGRRLVLIRWPIKHRHTRDRFASQFRKGQSLSVCPSAEASARLRRPTEAAWATIRSRSTVLVLTLINQDLLFDLGPRQACFDTPGAHGTAKEPPAARPRSSPQVSMGDLVSRAGDAACLCLQRKRRRRARTPREEDVSGRGIVWPQRLRLRKRFTLPQNAGFVAHRRTDSGLVESNTTPQHPHEGGGPRIGNERDRNRLRPHRPT